VEARFSALVQSGPGAHPGVRCSGRNLHHPSQSSQSQSSELSRGMDVAESNLAEDEILFGCYREYREGIQSRYLKFYTYFVFHLMFNLIYEQRLASCK